MLKIGKDHKLVEYLENSIKSGFSPYATLQNIVNEGHNFNTKISVKIFYNYIDAGLFMNISNKDLPVKKDKKSVSIIKSEQKLPIKRLQVLQTRQLQLMH